MVLPQATPQWGDGGGVAKQTPVASAVLDADGRATLPTSLGPLSFPACPQVPGDTC